MQRSILIIDDDRMALATARAALERDGYRVLCSDNPIGTIFLIHREKPDLVLVDVNMPAMDGPSMVASLQNRYAGEEDLPRFLLYSSVEEDRLRRIASLCDVEGYAVKDVACQDLRRKVRAVFDPDGASAPEPENIRHC